MNPRSKESAPPSNAPVIVALIAVVAAIGVVGYFAFFNTGQKTSPAASSAEPAVRNVR